MQDYVEVYLIGMGYEPWFMNNDDPVPCEICGEQFHDVHHIERRGMGGTEKEYFVEEMMALCRDDHFFFGDKKKFRVFLYWVHYLKMKQVKREIDFDKLPRDLFFEQYSDEQKITSGYYAHLLHHNYYESMTYSYEGGREKITILINNARGKKITEVSGFDRYTLIKQLITILL